jgi:hypothetical protein
MSSRTIDQFCLCEVEEKTYRSRSTVHDSLLRNWKHSPEYILVIWNIPTARLPRLIQAMMLGGCDGKGMSLAEFVIAERQISLDRIRLSLVGLQF